MALWCILIWLTSREITPSDQPTLESLIYSTAIKHHIEPKLLMGIARCESGLRIEAKNPHSTASGLFQFLTSTFISQASAYDLPIVDKNDPTVQVELAASMIEDGKISAWSASQSCWKSHAIPTRKNNHS